MNECSDVSQGKDSSWLRREAVIDRFEAAWQEHGDADLAEFLPPPGSPDRVALLGELIKIDLEYRWERGQRLRVEDYARRFPELAGNGPPPLGLIPVGIRRRHFDTCPPR